MADVIEKRMSLAPCESIVMSRAFFINVVLFVSLDTSRMHCPRMGSGSWPFVFLCFFFVCMEIWGVSAHVNAGGSPRSARYRVRSAYSPMHTDSQFAGTTMRHSFSDKESPIHLLVPIHVYNKSRVSKGEKTNGLLPIFPNILESISRCLQEGHICHLLQCTHASTR